MLHSESPNGFYDFDKEFWNHVCEFIDFQIYNLKREDFPTLRDYNDYLERVENIVMNLTYDIDVEETEMEVNRFKEEYSELIERNKRKVRSFRCLFLFSK